MLECNTIEGVDFGRRDVKIANEIYGYSKDATDGKFKHPCISIKIYRTTEDVAALISPKIMEHYSDLHLDLGIMFVNNVVFFIEKFRDIGLIHCKVILIKSDKQVVNELISIVLDYEARGFKVTITFADDDFKCIIKWMREELHIYLTTYADDSHVPRAENTIKFVKERDMINDNDKLEVIDDMGEEYNVLLNGNIANENNQVNHFGAYQHGNQ